MPFVKLDVGLIDSSLWVDMSSTRIFMTALCMMVPFELRAPTPQIAIRSLDRTGWIVPEGWYGLVPAAGVGIVRRALLKREAGLAALERLGSPEADSRSDAYQGRRLVRIDGGFLVMNAQVYREKDYGSAQRSKSYRARQAKLVAAKLMKK